MEVILLEKIERLGNLGDTVVVKNGYARNYLIPQGKALRATNENKKEFEQKRTEIEKQDDAKKSDAEKVLKKVNEKFVLVIRQAADDGRLYGSVTARDIVKVIGEEFAADLDKKVVQLGQPIKYLGVHEVVLQLHGDVSAKLFANVARSEGEAEEAKKEFLNPTKKKEKEEDVAEAAEIEEKKDSKAKEEDSKEAKESTDDKKAEKKEAKADVKAEEKPEVSEEDKGEEKK